MDSCHLGLMDPVASSHHAVGKHGQPKHAHDLGDAKRIQDAGLDVFCGRSLFVCLGAFRRV